MNTSSKRNLYISVLGVCAFGFLIDRALLAPDGAEASPGAVALAVAAEPVQSDSNPSAAAEDVLSGVGVVATQLLAIAERQTLDLAAMPDAFTPPRSWLPADGVRILEDDGIDDAEVLRFRETHRLTAVLTGSANGQAIIDGRGVRVGETVDGFTLVEVGPDTALLERGKRQVRLSIER